MNELFQTVQQTQVPIPTIELLLLLIVLTVSLVFKSTRIGLLAAYVFVYRWGWLFFRETFHGQNDLFLFGYLIFGALVILLSIILMLYPGE
jgi:hypothetical protein